MRLLAPATGAVGIKTDRREYRGRILEVSDRQDIKELRAVGYTPGDIGGPLVTRGGYECRPCGFASYFKKCSRCGSACDRPDLVA